MGILLAILAGGGSLLNFMYGQNQLIQYLLTALSVISLFVYRGKRTRKSYQNIGVSIFTIRFAICVIS
ncbi:MAG: hypothetical protein E6346_13175, partial [Lactococcus lactis]|nr:hypothetical protein [Lactococcus lactis]